MLFAQSAIALAACDWGQRAPAQAIALNQTPPCHEKAPASRNLNLCLADCLSFDQSSSTPPLPLLALPSAPVLIIVLPDHATLNVAAAQSALPHPPAPPPRILFQSFQI
jgi:hypothetical protein